MDTRTAQQFQQEMQEEVKKFEESGKKLSALVSQRAKLVTQQNENELVNKEFALLDDEASIYKLVGPVLVKQETDEAKSNVTNRLKWIQGEIERIDKQQKELETQRRTSQEKIMRVQETARKMQQEAVKRQLSAKS